MGDDAVIRLGYDNAKVRSGARETEAIMQRSAAKVKHDWNETSKKLKDAFEPMSRGALVHAGGVGVAIYGATMAVSKFRETVERLSKAEYLSQEQQNQMGHLATQFERIDHWMDKVTAKAIAGTFNFFSGGNFDKAVQYDAAGKSYERQAGLIKEITAMEKSAAEEQMTTAEKLAAKKADVLAIEEDIAKENARTFDTADKRAESQEKMLTMQKQLLGLQKDERGLQKTLADENKTAADKEATRRQKAGDILADMQEKELRAAGKNKQADKLAKEHRIDTRTRDIAAQLGIDPADARGIAEREAALQEKIDKRSGKGGRRRISGYGRDQHQKNKFLDHRSFNQFFHAEEVEYGQRSALPFMEQDWTQSFHRRENRLTQPPDQTRRGFGTSSQKTSGGDDATRLLQRIAQGIDLLTR